MAGKPHPPMADLVRAVGGPAGTVVGDRPDTDGAFARTLGYRFALVLTGVTHEADLPVEPAPDVVAPSLAALVGELPRSAPCVASSPDVPARDSTTSRSPVATSRDRP